jgi:ABC-type proline/glycine betaine transport system permease subunit
MKNKKGQVQNGIYQLIFLAIGLVVVGVVVAFGAKFISDQQADLTAGTTAYNATVESLGAMQDVAEGQGTITTVGILAVVIGLLLGVVALFGFMRGQE